MPKSTKPSNEADLRKLLRPNAERLTFQISAPSYWIDGETSELVSEATVLGVKSQERMPFTPIQRMKAEAAGIPVRWPKTAAKPSGKPSGQGS